MMSLDVGRKRVGRLFQVGVLAAAVASCGDADSTGPSSSDTTPPSVVSTDPAAGTFGASRNATVHVTFSEPIAPATVTGSSFTVTAGGSGLSGTVSASGSVATWTPAADLAAGTQYTATLSTAITDVAGNALASSVTWNFSTNAAPTIATASEVDATRGTDVTLDASGSTDPDPGQTLTFAWTQVYGPAVTLSSATAAAPTFTAPDEIATLAFDLVVSDGAEEVAERVTIWVLENGARHYWVSLNGSDTNAGTRAEPFATIQTALETADEAGQFGDVYVAGGVYDGSIWLRAGVSIYGGFDPVTFLRDVAAHETEINGGPQAIRGRHLSGNSPLTLNGLTIRAANDSTLYEGSSYAIRLYSTPNVIISHNRIIAGSGTNGRDGLDGINGVAGAAGSFGINASLFCSDLAGGAGGDNGVSNAGGNGGRSGRDGLTGQGGAASGTGAGGAGDGDPGGNGGHGGTGSTWPYSGSPGIEFGSLAPDGGNYIPSYGVNGVNGQSGVGGGGGGGGADALFACGGSGGGGGGGGAGGQGGRAGGGGGGSFGIVVTGSSTNVTIVNNDITTGNGGHAGKGGAPGSGGAGGVGRTGGNGTNGSGDGGRGGNGGAGGMGTPGTGGGGGPSIGIAVGIGSSTNLTPTSLAGNTFTLGAAGSGGAGGAYNVSTGLTGLRTEYYKVD
ncbi:MAG: Ig-like domain-containing protein [Gemmatimonadetes bacterium]|nr:Ig-like domain-containing protein [Gemmatimonadota bacterium]